MIKDSNFCGALTKTTVRVLHREFSFIVGLLLGRDFFHKLSKCPKRKQNFMRNRNYLYTTWYSSWLGNRKRRIRLLVKVKAFPVIVFTNLISPWSMVILFFFFLMQSSKCFLVQKLTLSTGHKTVYIFAFPFECRKQFVIVPENSLSSRPIAFCLLAFSLALMIISLLYQHYYYYYYYY